MQPKSHACDLCQTYSFNLGLVLPVKVALHGGDNYGAATFQDILHFAGSPSFMFVKGDTICDKRETIVVKRVSSDLECVTSIRANQC